MKGFCRVAAVLLVARVACADEPVPADLVMRNGAIYTADASGRVAQALAINGNRIAAVGTDEEIGRLVGEKTKVIDLAGQAAYPGFIESHGHLLSVGQAKMILDLVGTESYEDVVARVKAAVAKAKPGAWIVGRGWHEGKWKPTKKAFVRGFPSHQALSAVSPRNPVFLGRADGHAAMVNARTLALMKIDAQTKAPEGGEIIRDAAGRPTGILVDNAQDLVKVPPLDEAGRKRAIELAMQACLENGITTFTDAGASTEELKSMKEAAQGMAPVRLYVMLQPAAMRELGVPEVGAANGMLTVRAVKIVADGALGSRGAALLEPYLDDPGNSGFFTTPPAEVLDTIRWAFAHGFQPAIHAIGDRANRSVLDAFEAALKENPAGRETRPRIEHAQILDEVDIPRFAQLGVTPSMQGIHATSDRPWAPERIGMARVTEGAYVWQKLLASGARIPNGTDAPVEDLSAIRSFHASVTRQGPDGQPAGGFDPDQKMTREQALRSYTIDGAWAAHDEANRGSLEPGKLADVVVLSRDIMKVPDAEILEAKVTLTMVDGKAWYHRPAPTTP
jgi:predicted amidohydrolase YtcJ